MKNLEERDRKNLIMRRKWEAGYLRDHKKKLQKGICLSDTKKYRYPQRSKNAWSGLKEEVITAKNVQ